MKNKIVSIIFLCVLSNILSLITLLFYEIQLILCVVLNVFFFIFVQIKILSLKTDKDYIIIYYIKKQQQKILQFINLYQFEYT